MDEVRTAEYFVEHWDGFPKGELRHNCWKRRCYIVVALETRQLRSVILAELPGGGDYGMAVHVQVYDPADPGCCIINSTLQESGVRQLGLGSLLDRHDNLGKVCEEQLRELARRAKQDPSGMEVCLRGLRDHLDEGITNTNGLRMLAGHYMM